MTPSLPQLQEILTNRSQEAEKIKADIATAKELLASCEDRLNKLLGVSTPAPEPAEPKYKPLRQFVRDILNQSNEPLTVKEISELVLEAGYKTASENFNNIVHTTIYNDKEIKRRTKPNMRPVRYSLDSE